MVEDECSLRRAYRKALEPIGYRVLEAEGPEEGLALARKHHPTLALLDAHFPNAMDGYELCRVLTRDEPHPVDVFLISGLLCPDADRFRGYEAGAVAYYLKSISTSSLVKDVRTFMTRPKPFFQRHALPRPVAENALDAPRVLIIDDSEDQRECVAIHLETDGMVPYVAASGMEGILTAHRLVPDAIVLDLSLGDMRGEEVIACLRAHGRTEKMPIFVWTASEKPGQEVACFRGGAADYLHKASHDLAAMGARIRLKLSVSRGTGTGAGSYVGGPVTVNWSTRTILVDGHSLTGVIGREFDLLAYLIAANPRIVSWDELETRVWKVSPENLTHSHASEAIRVALSHIKESLGAAGDGLITHRGQGLQFDPSKARR